MLDERRLKSAVAKLKTSPKMEIVVDIADDSFVVTPPELVTLALLVFAYSLRRKE